MADQRLAHLPPSTQSSLEGKNNQICSFSHPTVAFTSPPSVANVSAQQYSSSSLAPHSKNCSNTSLLIRNSPNENLVPSLPRGKFFSETPLPKGFRHPYSTDLNDYSRFAACSLPTSFKDEVNFSSLMLDSPMLVFPPHTVLGEGIPFFASGVPALEAYAQRS